MQQGSFSINSKHFITRIENDIIQLIKTLVIEHQISIDEAKIMARRMVQNKVNQMLTEDELTGIKELSAITNDIIKAPKEDCVCVGPVRKYARQVYELLKTMGFK